jgi:hypothetical protein
MPVEWQPHRTVLELGVHAWAEVAERAVVVIVDAGFRA